MASLKCNMRVRKETSPVSRQVMRGFEAVMAGRNETAWRIVMPDNLDGAATVMPPNIR